jgi:hypothetical protein
MIILPIEFLLSQGHTKFGVTGTDMASASWPFFYFEESASWPLRAREEAQNGAHHQTVIKIRIHASQHRADPELNYYSYTGTMAPYIDIRQQLRMLNRATNLGFKYS